MKFNAQLELNFAVIINGKSVSVMPPLKISWCTFVFLLVFQKMYHKCSGPLSFLTIQYADGKIAQSFLVMAKVSKIVFPENVSFRFQLTFSRKPAICRKHLFGGAFRLFHIFLNWWSETDENVSNPDFVECFVAVCVLIQKLWSKHCFKWKWRGF